MKLGWGFVAMAALALAGCDASFSSCSERNDAGLCIFDDDDDFPDLDANFGSDAGDGGPRSDGGTNDGGGVASDSGLGGMDASVDASVPLTPTTFCNLQLGRAYAWLDYFESSCQCLSQTEREDRDYLLGAALLYNDSAGVNCINAVTNLQQRSTVTYNAASAASCATRFAEQFAAPPASCSAGVELERTEAMIGHGVQQLAQLSECRATFTGKVARDGTCTDSFDCASGLRCQPLPGSTPADGGVPMSCQPARGNLETCASRSDCADGFICARSDSSATGANCIAANELRTVNGPCRASRECEVGLICNCATADCGSGTCITAPATAAICKP